MGKVEVMLSKIVGAKKGVLEINLDEGNGAGIILSAKSLEESIQIQEKVEPLPPANPSMVDYLKNW